MRIIPKVNDELISCRLKCCEILGLDREDLKKPGKSGKKKFALPGRIWHMNRAARVA